MELLINLIDRCTSAIHLILVKADLIPQLVKTLNPLSLSLTESIHIHTYLILTIALSLKLATPLGVINLENTDQNEQQAVHETVLQQVLAPSEQYIWHLCVFHRSIVDGVQSSCLQMLLTELIRISPYYQPTMDFVLNIPIFLTIPSFLTFFVHDNTIRYWLNYMIGAQWEWKKTRGDQRLPRKAVLRILRMEGIEDVIEEKLRNDENGDEGDIVANSIILNNLQGMNLQQRS
ncbi:hypothetical protein BLNAU_12327 [Blattamonas nauphoetae]|uniref:Uncharacterized protein n=1 Tax=Blattamonas nauphoetae TaxID=2049346 RepID=A0ABQ9XJR7_9EUKA|nr:hypothetical protein BLNAU_12327 [Blattamonas nauphoetae]